MTAPRLRALALLSITLLHGWTLWQAQRPAAVQAGAPEPAVPLPTAA